MNSALFHCGVGTPSPFRKMWARLSCSGKGTAAGTQSQDREARRGRWEVGSARTSVRESVDENTVSPIRAAIRPQEVQPRKARSRRPLLRDCSTFRLPQRGQCFRRGTGNHSLGRPYILAYKPHSGEARDVATKTAKPFGRISRQARPKLTRSEDAAIARTDSSRVYNGPQSAAR